MAFLRTTLLFLVLRGYLLVNVQSQTVTHPDDNNNDVCAADNDNNTKEPFTLEDIYSGRFISSGFNGTWISDTEIEFFNSSTGDLTTYNVTARKTEPILEGSKLPMKNFSKAIMSADHQYILYGYNTIRIDRYTRLMSYMVYDRNRNIFENVANEAPISLALWSPKGSNMVYVLNNDIYHMVFINGTAKVERLTKDGYPEYFFNGIPDWNYRGKIFSSGTASWFSPNGKYFAYASFNDALIKDMVYLRYGNSRSIDHQYPEVQRRKYSKPGTSNPPVTFNMVKMFNLSLKAIPLKMPEELSGRDSVLGGVSWWKSTQVIVAWMNRMQNRSQFVMYDDAGNDNMILDIEETVGWLNPSAVIRVDDYALLLLMEESGTSAGRFRHITRYQYKGGKLISPTDLTPGPSEVHSIVTVDSRTKIVYYLATTPGNPNQRHLYSVPVDASQKPTCISCELLTLEGNKCTYVNAAFSRKCSYYALSCYGPDPITVTIYDKDHRFVVGWTNNTELREALSKRLMPQQRDLNVTVNGYDSRVRLLLPPNFDEKKSYPLLVHVYGGPDYVTITDSAKYSYNFYLTTNKSIIYSWIDGRGSGNKGSKMLFEVYRRLGTVEVEDTIAVTKFLIARHKWIDANRVGIWGWSYGGFNTAMTLATDTDNVFKCGISVAPVTAWIYFNSIYTERYMGLPFAEDNLAGYDRADITRRVNGIRGKKFMLIHGSDDRNVHYQHSMALSKALQDEGVLFQQITYTDKMHNLKNVRPHFYRTMDKFWNECFHLDHARGPASVFRSESYAGETGSQETPGLGKMGIVHSVKSKCAKPPPCSGDP